NSVAWIRPENAGRVIGVQGCAWAEFINDEKHLEYMIFPRLLAIAEMAWTQEEKREWQHFKPRMNAHIPQLLARGINSFTLTDEIELTTRKVEHGGMEVMLDTEKYPVEIRYTLDGKIPGATSLRYDKPFIINDSVVVKAAIFREGKILGPILERNVGTEKEIRNYFEYVEPEHWKNVKQ
ncbi:family 20 glycosylhydrolase, partial [Bacteroides caccae]